jgi:DMSO/TMAO reductase YedYZ molybdopterin-dependent catalytic subunit
MSSPADTETTPRLAAISEPSRVAGDDEAIGFDELGLAARNHGMPLEAMRWEVTPLGMHYLLTHYDIPFVDDSDWRLEIGGLVDRPVSLDLTELRARPRVTQRVTMECAGNGRARLRPRPVSQPWLHEAVGTMEWTGTPLGPLLRDAGPSPDATDVVFTGADHGVEKGTEQDYQRGLSLDDAVAGDVLLAYEANGVPLPPQHGFPLRLLVPGWYGMASVKWLRSIELVDQPFEGYQQRAYRLRQETGEDGEPLSRIAPRALMVPPGSPDFLSRRRFLRAGRVVLEGRAWSGWGEVTKVEVTSDGGASWQDAELEPAAGRYAWRRWTFPWEASAGTHTLSARATDATGRTQPDAQPWNRGGFANTSLQQVEVLVLPPS